MPALPLPDADVKAVAEYIHSVAGHRHGTQGAPPPSETPPPNAIVGDAAAGEVYFAAKCSSCHSPTGDLQGIGTRVPEGKALQNAWVTGSAGEGGRGRRAAASTRPREFGRRTVTATVTLPGGEQVQGPLCGSTIS